MASRFVSCFVLVGLVAAATNVTKNECQPSKTCNVCADCCHSYITDGTHCDTCVKTTCSTKNECNPTKTCNVCADCCHSYITDGTQCDSCVNTTCNAKPTPAPAPKNKCLHGGTLDPKTGNCSDCAGAWSGPKCATYNPAVSSAQQIKLMVQVANQSQLMLDTQATLQPPPLCSQSNECAGWGATAFGEGVAPALMPILHLTYPDQARTWHGKREPAEASVNGVISPAYANEHMFKVLPTIDEYKQFVHSVVGAENGGSNGIYGDSFKNVYEKYYAGGSKGLTVSSALLTLVNIDIQPDPITHSYQYAIDRFAARAINSLPPPPTDTSPAGLSAWWALHGALFRTFFGKYGSSVITHAKVGGMVEQASQYAHTTKSSTTQLQQDAENDFHAAAGIGGGSGVHDPALTNQPIGCTGGDSSLCSKAGGIGAGIQGKWGLSVQTAPRLLQFNVVQLDQFFQGSSEFGPDVQQTLVAGIRGYIEEQQQTVTWSWDMRGSGGNCDKATRSGTLLETPGKTLPASSCNNNPCAITLQCARLPDGNIQAVHTGCKDVFKGSSVSFGCSVITANGVEQPKAGKCCHY